MLKKYLDDFDEYHSHEFEWIPFNVANFGLNQFFTIIEKRV